ncbi:cryptochrome/photolyase family protein [Aquibaculum sediminis]|uniref:cryptochrome/photolyase family protein n=1 Tax=Aquibaculum sediminis TaxID=3231907 RepID=UPI0034519100
MSPKAPSEAPSLVWFRQDLRLSDNPALSAAAERGRPLLPVYILDEEAAGTWAPGGAARWWLHRSLTALKESLQACGSNLLLLRGPSEALLPDLVQRLGADAVFWNRCYEPWRQERDTRIKQALKAQGVRAESHKAALLAEPWDIATGSGTPYKRFTPFWKALRAFHIAEALPAPKKLPPPPAIDGERLEDWGLLPTRPDWAGGLRATWQVGEAAAQARLDDFLAEAVDYGKARDRLDQDATSRLSPHLHWGEISPRQVWHAALAASHRDDAKSDGLWKFLSELAWREFSYHLLHHWPDLPHRNWQGRFDQFRWLEDEEAFTAWTRGRTGYPLVDAGMRQLWHEGWMHNRARMVTGSFLVKHLLQPWQKGEAWFWDTLVDADLASNAASWQWVAGSGADAAPYFRIFNPVRQSETFDPQARYLRRWLPELAELPDRWLHRPWEASEATLTAAGVRLGRDYPRPIVDHAAARQRALDAFAAIRQPG